MSHWFETSRPKVTSSLHNSPVLAFPLHPQALCQHVLAKHLFGGLCALSMASPLMQTPSPLFPQPLW